MSQNNLSKGLLKQANHDLKATGFGDQGFWLGYNMQKLAHAQQDREENMMKQAREMPGQAKSKQKEQAGGGINPLLLGLGGAAGLGGLGLAGYKGYLGDTVQDALGGKGMYSINNLIQGGEELGLNEEADVEPQKLDMAMQALQGLGGGIL